MTPEEFEELSALRRIQGPVRPIAAPAQEGQTFKKESMTQVAPTMGEYVEDKAKKGFRNILGMPAIAAEAANFVAGPWARMLGAPAEPFAPGAASELVNQAVDDNLRVAGVGPIKDLRSPDRFSAMLGNGVELGVGALPFGAINVVQSPQKALTAAGEVFSVLGGAVGMTLGKHATEGKGEGLEATGEFVGGAAGSVAGSGLGAMAVKKGYDWYKNKFGEEGREKAGGLKARAFAEEVADTSDLDFRAKQVRELEKEIPGFRPTLVMETGSPVAKSMSESRQMHSAEFMQSYRQRKMSNENAIYSYINSKYTRPPSPALQFALKRKYDDGLAGIEQKRQHVDNMTEYYLTDYNQAPNVKSGDALRALAEEKRKVAKDGAEARYNYVYGVAEQKGVQIPREPYLNMRRNWLSSDSETYQKLPDLSRQILERDGPMSFEEFHSLLKEVRLEKRLQERRPVEVQDRPYIAKLNVLQQQLMGDLEGSAKSGSQVRNLLDAADKYYVDNVYNKFYTGIGREIFEVDRDTGRVHSGINDVVRKVVLNKDDVNGVANFIDVFGDSQQAMYLLNKSVLYTFGEKAVKKGKLDPASADKFLTDYAHVLDKLPGVKGMIESTKNNVERLAQVNASLQQDYKSWSNTALAEIAGEPDFNKVVNKALTDQRYMTTLVWRARKEKRQDELATSLVSAVAQKPDSLDFLIKNEQKLRPAFAHLGEKHWDNLMNFAKAKHVTDEDMLAGSFATGSIPPDILQEKTGMTPGTAFSIGRSMQTGHISPATAAVTVFSRFGYKVAAEHANEAIEALLLKPKLLESYYSLGRKAPTQSQKDEVGHLLFTLGVRATLLGEMAADDE